MRLEKKLDVMSYIVGSILCFPVVRLMVSITFAYLNQGAGYQKYSVINLISYYLTFRVILPIVGTTVSFR